MTVNDPTMVRRLLAGRNVPMSPASPTTAHPLSTAGHSSGVVLRVRRRTDSSHASIVDGRQSVILFDKHQMERRAKRASRRPSYRRLQSTPSSSRFPIMPVLVTCFLEELC